jgi:hypothetical protein
MENAFEVAVANKRSTTVIRSRRRKFQLGNSALERNVDMLLHLILCFVESLFQIYTYPNELPPNDYTCMAADKKLDT